MSSVLTAEEFWGSRVDIRPELDSCWLYRADAPGFRNASGHVRLSTGLAGGKIYAHRFAYVSVFGPIGDQWVLHVCDVPRCVAPWHLELGDCRINVASREARNRRTPFLKRTPEHHSSRLSQAAADEIREAHRIGVRLPALIQEYGVSATTVRAFLAGDRYIKAVGATADPPSSLVSQESTAP